MASKWLVVEEAATLLGCPEPDLVQLGATGRVRTREHEGRTQYRRADLDQLALELRAERQQVLQISQEVGRALVEVVAVQHDLIAAKDEIIALRDTVSALRAEIERLRAEQERRRRHYLEIIQRLIKQRSR